VTSRTFFCAGIALVAAVLGTVTTVQAGNTGILRLDVLDPHGAPVEGARVVLTNPVIGSFKMEAATDKRGRASFLGLPPGELAYRVDKGGYQSYESNFMARAGETTSLKIKLSALGGGAPAEAKQGDAAWVTAHNEAVGLYQKDKQAEALQAAERALAAKADFVPALALKGIILEGQGKCGESMTPLKQACQPGSAPPDALAALIRCLEKTGKKEEAAAYRKMQEATGRSVTDLYNEAVAKINAGDDDAAAPLLEQALRQDQGFALAQYQYGLILFRRGDVPGAIARLETYLKLAPNGEFAADARDFLQALER